MAVPSFTHSIGPQSLDHVCVHRDLTAGEAKELARSIGTALALFAPGIGASASAYFIGQCAHESGEFRFSREIWGPTAVQAGYWKRRDIQGPGILKPELGKHYRGGGWIQTTGRVNFRAAARRLRDAGLHAPSSFWLAAHAHEPFYASALAAIWWGAHFPRDMSGSEWNVARVSRIVNGKHPANGLAERRMYTTRAMEVRRFLDPEPIRK